MPLRLPDKWVWDFWLARSDGAHHVFYLQAPRLLGDTSLRHHHASIGHAVSTDLRQWRPVGDAVLPGPPGSWDDLATWTGSVIEHDDRWHMLYTGINRSEGGLIQRVGLAVSDDLLHWRKHPANPVLESDGRWYEQLDLERWRDQSWRDPWLYRDGAGRFNVLLTARSRDGEPDGAGVVARAVSTDLVDWQVRPPLTACGDFAQVECPQLVELDGRRVILFSCLAEDHSAARRERLGVGGVTGTFTYVSNEPDEAFVAGASPVVAPDSSEGPLYAGKLVDDAGNWAFMGFRGAGDRDFVGELSDPIRVRLDPDGSLRAIAGEEVAA
jgi:beta-fructofuranosidase